MSDFDLDRLGDVWRQQPDPAEMDRLQRAATAIARRARWGQVVDVVAALAVSVVVLFLVLANPDKNTIVVGAGTVLLLLFSQRRQRRLREIELLSLTGTAEDMIEQSIARIRATLKRTRLSLLLLGPGILLGLLFAHLAQSGAERSLVLGMEVAPWLRSLIRYGAPILVAIIAYGFYRTDRNARQELKHLVLLQEAYRKEREGTARD